MTLGGNSFGEQVAGCRGCCLRESSAFEEFNMISVRTSDIMSGTGADAYGGQ